MATTNWALQGDTPTTIGATDLIQFAAASFGDPILVGAYNDSTHVQSSGGADVSNGNTPNNNKFISQSGGTGGNSQADWGDGTEDLDQITNAEAALHIQFTDNASVEVFDHVFYAYNGSNTAIGPTDVDVRVAEVGDTNFTNAGGSGNALSLADRLTPATSHDFYIVLSASPTATGVKDDFMFRDELSYV